jgi:hypothetical protein
MADQITVTGVELRALVGKLAVMSESFTDQEQAALAVLVALAGDGLLEGGAEVEGFGIAIDNMPASLSFVYGGVRPQQTDGILIGLLKNGTPGLAGFNRIEGGGGIG